jgi:hypothetical protein
MGQWYIAKIKLPKDPEKQIKLIAILEYLYEDFYFEASIDYDENDNALFHGNEYLKEEIEDIIYKLERVLEISIEYSIEEDK